MHESPVDRRSLIITSAVNLCTADDVSYVTDRRSCQLLRGVPCNYLIVCPGVLYAVSATMETNKMPGLSPSWVPTLCSGQLLFLSPPGLIVCPSPPPGPLPLLCIFHHIHTDCRNYLPNISIHPFSSLPFSTYPIQGL